MGGRVSQCAHGKMVGEWGGGEVGTGVALGVLGVDVDALDFEERAQEPVVPVRRERVGVRGPNERGLLPAVARVDDRRQPLPVPAIQLRLLLPSLCFLVLLRLNLHRRRLYRSRRRRLADHRSNHLRQVLPRRDVQERLAVCQ